MQDTKMENTELLNGYLAFYKGKQYEVYAKTSYEAQQKAATFYKTKKAYEIAVVPAEKDNKPVIHIAVD